MEGKDVAEILRAHNGVRRNRQRDVTGPARAHRRLLDCQRWGVSVLARRREETERHVLESFVGILGLGLGLVGLDHFRLNV